MKSKTILIFLCSLIIGKFCFVQTTDNYFDRAYSCFENGKTDSIIYYMDEIIKREPNNSKAYALRGSAKSDLKMNDAADDFEKALVLDSNNFDAHLYYGNYLSDQEKYLEALIHFDIVITRDLAPWRIDLLHNVAAIYEKMNDLDKAFANYSKIIASTQNPYSKRLAYQKTGDLHIQLNDYKQAKIDYESLIMADGGDEYAYYKLAVIYIHLGELKDVCHLLQAAKTANSEKIKECCTDLNELIVNYCK